MTTLPTSRDVGCKYFIVSDGSVDFAAALYSPSGKAQLFRSAK